MTGALTVGSARELFTPPTLRHGNQRLQRMTISTKHLIQQRGIKQLLDRVPVEMQLPANSITGDRATPAVFG